MGAGKPSAAERFAAAVVRLRWVVAGFWVAATVAVIVLLPTIREAQVGALGDLVPNDAEAIEAERRSAELFAFPLLSRTLVVQRDPDGLSAKTHAEALRLTVALNRGTLPVVDGIAGALLATNALGRPPFSRESSTTAIWFLFFPGDIGQLGRTSLARHFVGLHLERPPGGFVGVTGAIPARYEQSETIVDALPLVELATIILVALAVGLHFRAVGAPLINLAAVAVAYIVSARGVAWVGERAGVSVPAEVEPVIVVLLFGVVTDYSIFFFSRVRRRLVEGEAPRAAVERTTAELTPIILACGLTVAGGSAALMVARLGFLQAFGPGMAMAVLVALVVALTLVPAGLAIAGRAVFWPHRARVRTGEAEPLERGLSGRVVRFAVRRPWWAVAGCVLVIGAATTGVGRLEVGNPLMRALPADSEPRRAYAHASRGFAAGILSPTVVVVEDRGITRRRRALTRLQRAIDDRPGVAEVVGPAANPTGVDFGAVQSRTGNAARYLVVFAADPLGNVAIERLRDLRDDMPGLLRRAGLEDAEVSYAGDTALAAETIDDAANDLWRVLPVALAVILLILVVFLRSLVAPLYLLAAATLAPLAALGLTAHVFQGFLDKAELTYYVPIAGVVLLLSLGSDYNVFVTGRVWAEARARTLREAVIVGGAGAARAVAAAGLVLAASFSLLALVPLTPFRELAFLMAAGLLIEAFIVRTLLIPAVITLFGYRSGWPGRRLRRRRGARAGQGAKTGRIGASGSSKRSATTR